MSMRASLPESPCRQSHHTYLVVFFAIFIFLFFVAFPLSHRSLTDPLRHMFSCPCPSSSSSSSQSVQSKLTEILEEEKDGDKRVECMLYDEDDDNKGNCDHTRGEWVLDEEEPRYNNSSCWMIEERENCLKHGRPDTDYMKWRWKPTSCKLNKLDARCFFQLVRGKTMAFIGDSLARNQMQSLMCLLSKVAYPKVIPYGDNDDYKHVFYEEYNFTLWLFWSPCLVRGYEPDSKNKYWRLYLDEIDRTWANEIPSFDYIIIGDGNWFVKTSLFYEGGEVTGCNGCTEEGIRDLSLLYSSRKAFRTAFSSILEAPGYRGMTFLRTLSPDHFENGDWDTGGYCNMTRPYRNNEGQELSWLETEMYGVQVEEFREAQRKAKEKGLRFGLLDVTRAMFLRPDGHPNAYGHWPGSGKRNDCVHWCMPGPVDFWNDVMFQMMVANT